MRIFGLGSSNNNPHPGVIDDVSPERRDEILDYMAKKITDYGMTVPAILFLESHKPFSYIGSQAMHFFAPFGDVLVGSPYLSEMGYIFQERENVDRLIDRLEDLAAELDRKEQEAKNKENTPDEEPEAPLE